jgi:polyphosphate kinase
VADLFNRMTGFARPEGYRHLLVAPTLMKQQILDLVAFEAAEARAGRPATIIAKCNAVTDIEVVEALYEASSAGVRIELLVRGICSLIPGIPGRSDNVRVRSVLGRFLEHERVFWFHHAGEPKVYIGSADWMHRNLERRVEVLVPVLDPVIARWLRDVLLARYLDDRNRSWEMQPDGTYVRLRRGDGDPDVHEQFMADREGVPQLL